MNNIYKTAFWDSIQNLLNSIPKSCNIQGFVLYTFSFVIPQSVHFDEMIFVGSDQTFPTFCHYLSGV